MKIRQSFEQAICILLLISKSEGPLKSHDLSEKLHVSDSYLKKNHKTACCFRINNFKSK